MYASTLFSTTSNINWEQTGRIRSWFNQRFNTLLPSLMIWTLLPTESWTIFLIIKRRRITVFTFSWTILERYVFDLLIGEMKTKLFKDKIVLLNSDFAGWWYHSLNYLNSCILCVRKYTSFLVWLHVWY